MVINNQATDNILDLGFKLGHIGRFNFSNLLTFTEKIELLQFLVNSSFDTELIKFEIKHDFHKLGVNIKDKQLYESKK